MPVRDRTRSGRDDRRGRPRPSKGGWSRSRAPSAGSPDELADGFAVDLSGGRRRPCGSSPRPVPASTATSLAVGSARGRHGRHGSACLHRRRHERIPGLAAVGRRHRGPGGPDARPRRRHRPPTPAPTPVRQPRPRPPRADTDADPATDRRPPRPTADAPGPPRPLDPRPRPCRRRSSPSPRPGACPSASRVAVEGTVTVTGRVACSAPA